MEIVSLPDRNKKRRVELRFPLIMDFWNETGNMSSISEDMSSRRFV